MIKRKRKSHSYDMNKYNKQNKLNFVFKNYYKKKSYSFPKIKRFSKEILFDSFIKDGEVKKEPSEKNIKEISDISAEKNNNKKSNSSQSDIKIKFHEKNLIKLLKEETDKNMNNINVVKNELNKENITPNNKNNNLEIQENEKNNINDEKNKLFLELKEEPLNNELYNNSIFGFRHSSYDKYKREIEKNKKVYINKRFINFSNIIEDLEKKPKELIENSLINENKQKLAKKENFKELLLNNKEKNKKLDENIENQDSSQGYQKIEDNYIEENENEIRKVDITEYRYKIKYRPNQFELKTKILAEINNLKNKLLLNEKNNRNNNSIVIHKKIEIKAFIETKNKPLNEIINKTYYIRDNSETKHKLLKNEAKSDITREELIKSNHIKNETNILANTPDITNYIISHKTMGNNDINNNNIYSKINPNYIHNYIKNDNIFNINNTFNIYNQNYFQKEENEKQKISLIKNNKINLSNLKDYKYFHYINKKNKKLKKLDKVFNPNESTESGKINNLINEFMAIKKNKRKRFHRNINNEKEE